MNNTITIEGWVARDKSSFTAFFSEDKPRRGIDSWFNKSGSVVPIPRKYFPSLTWEDEPKKVKITVTMEV